MQDGRLTHHPAACGGGRPTPTTSSLPAGPAQPEEEARGLRPPQSLGPSSRWPWPHTLVQAGASAPPVPVLYPGAPGRHGDREAWPAEGRKASGWPLQPGRGNRATGSPSLGHTGREGATGWPPLSPGGLIFCLLSFRTKRGRHRLASRGVAGNHGTRPSPPGSVAGMSALASSSDLATVNFLQRKLQSLVGGPHSAWAGQLGSLAPCPPTAGLGARGGRTARHQTCPRLLSQPLSLPSVHPATPKLSQRPPPVSAPGIKHLEG